MIKEILDILFPPKCPFCKEILTEKAPVCRNCMETLPFIYGKSCDICGRPLEEFSHRICPYCHNRRVHFQHCFVPLIYEDKAKDTVLALKKLHPYYAKAFAYLLADKILTSPHYAGFDLITFVPQSPRSRRNQGYNHSELIAKELSALLHIPCKPTLKRSNAGLPQHSLTAYQRRENVKKCYFKTDFQGEGTALLVDDIYTTGATSDYCSKLLLQMGFKKVYLAIAMIRHD